jgi:hypothetical protein
VLRRSTRRSPLIEALAGVNRLVLLGDVLELRHRPLREVLAAAAPVLADLGAALGSDGEVLVVPGNHDHRLLREWLERRALDLDPPALGLESEVHWGDDEVLAQLARYLRPARVRVAYPGAWLRDDVYATHGHYSDRHTTVPILERLGAGLMSRVIREPDGGPDRAEDYEATLAPLYAWIDQIAESGRPQVGGGSGIVQVRTWHALGGSGRRWSPRQASLGLLFPAVIAALNRAKVGPLRADVSGATLRRAALRAFDEVLVRLGVRAPHVVFGHTHRAGPLPGDDHSEWAATSGVQLANSGSWVHEPRFLGRRPEESPYRPGFCVVLDEVGPPVLENLLDGSPYGLTPLAPG